MHATRLPILGFLLLALASVHAVAAPKIHKVLPHLLDKNGKHTIAPSLFERDAYQAHLRENHELQTGVRFDILWKASHPKSKELELFIELRTSKGDPTKTIVLKKIVKPTGWLRRWTSLTLSGEKFKTAGQVVAWRATLWDGDTFLSQQRSFLW